MIQTVQTYKPIIDMAWEKLFKTNMIIGANPNP